MFPILFSAMGHIQMYNPAAHILRCGLPDVGRFTWLMLGGQATRSSALASLRSVDDVACTLTHGALIALIWSWAEVCGWIPY